MRRTASSSVISFSSRTYVTEHARERAVGARMRLPLRQRPVVADRRRVGADRDERRRQAGAHVGLAHHVVQRAGAALGAG